LFLKKKRKQRKKPKKRKQRNKLDFIFIGLGNPGSDYAETRHNAGFLVLDGLANKFSIKLKKPFLKSYLCGRGEIDGKKFLLVKPLTYMNNSGLIMNDIERRYVTPSSALIVVCDNMDLRYGLCRIKKSGSPSGHNGIASIQQFYGRTDFYCIYVGVSRPPEGADVVSHVLGRPDGADFDRFMEGVEKGVSAAASLMNGDLQRVMNEYNRRNNSGQNKQVSQG